VPAGAGSSRSLRWENGTAAAIDDEYVRVQSTGCTTSCGPEAVYRIRAWDTTLQSPRFNNTGGQVTVLVLQNTSETTVTGHAYFWSSTGFLVGIHAFNLPGRAATVVNTSTLAGVAGASGSLTVSHDGAYGAVMGKVVAVESATGFTFDTALEPRRR
jgi:hypothetical protein